jgi:hypothetical protein
MRIRINLAITLVMCSMIFSQCRHAGQPELDQDDSSGLTQRPAERAAGTQENLIIQPQALLVSQVARPKAELREGPGVEFGLLDQTLPMHTAVVMLELKDVWQKIFVPQLGVTGWVHSKSLGLSRLNDEAMMLPAIKMPIVTAVKVITSASSFPDNQPMRITVSRGQVMVLLRRALGKNLVVLNDTRSLAWIAQEDLQ